MKSCCRKIINKKLLFLMEIKYKELGETISYMVLQLLTIKMDSTFKDTIKME